jgi:hypothetical protein
MDLKPHLSASLAKISVITSLGLGQALLIPALALLNQGFNVAATIGLARSGLAESVANFVGWQIVGGIFGLGAQITFAGMVRFFSLRFANAISGIISFRGG